MGGQPLQMREEDLMGDEKRKKRKRRELSLRAYFPPALSGAKTDPFLRGANFFWREKVLTRR